MNEEKVKVYYDSERIETAKKIRIYGIRFIPLSEHEENMDKILKNQFKECDKCDIAEQERQRVIEKVLYIIHHDKKIREYYQATLKIEKLLEAQK